MVIDAWTDQSGLDIEVAEHCGLLVITDTTGNQVMLTVDDALRLYAAVERFLVSKGELHG